jgi:hypothetical protein
VVGDASDVGQAGPEEAIRRMYQEGMATLAALHEGWNAALAEFRDVEADGGLGQAAA